MGTFKNPFSQYDWMAMLSLIPMPMLKLERELLLLLLLLWSLEMGYNRFYYFGILGRVPLASFKFKNVAPFIAIVL